MKLTSSIVSVAIDQSHVILRGDAAHKIGILAMRVLEMTVFIEPSAHYRSQQHRNCFFGAYFCHKPNQVISIVIRRRVAIDFFLRFIVMSELNKNVIAFVKLIDDCLPTVLRNECASTTAVLRTVVDDHLVVLEKLPQHLPQPVSGRFSGSFCAMVESPARKIVIVLRCASPFCVAIRIDRMMNRIALIPIELFHSP